MRVGLLCVAAALVAASGAQPDPLTGEDMGGDEAEEAGGVEEVVGLTDAEQGRRVVVVGDIHGDYLCAVKLLWHAGLVNASAPPVEWAGGSATLVQMGDLCDRGPFSPQLIDLFDITLRNQARAAGGDVVTLLGNHELLNVVGVSLRDDGLWLGGHGVSRAEVAAFPGDIEGRRSSFSPTGRFGVRLLDRFEGVHQIGGSVFVHAGITKPSQARLGVDGLRNAIRKSLNDRNFEPLFGDLNVFEPRDLLAKGEPRCELVDVILGLLNDNRAPGSPPAERIVVGHTPQYDGEGAVSMYCRGDGEGTPKLVAVDVAVSRWMWRGGWLGWLEMHSSRETEQCEDGRDGWWLLPRNAGRCDIPKEQPVDCSGKDPAETCPHPVEV